MADEPPSTKRTSRSFAAPRAEVALMLEALEKIGRSESAMCPECKAIMMTPGRIISPDPRVEGGTHTCRYGALSWETIAKVHLLLRSRRD
jgi:hypothetical protein